MDLQQEGFEQWNRRGPQKTTQPLVTIQMGGLFSLNKAAYEKMGCPSRVDLYYSAEKQAIALEPADDNSLSAYKLHRAGDFSTIYVSAQSFVKFYRIDASVSRRYIATFRNETLFLDLAGPSQIATKSWRRKPRV